MVVDGSPLSASSDPKRPNEVDDTDRQLKRQIRHNDFQQLVSRELETGGPDTPGLDEFLEGQHGTLTSCKRTRDHSNSTLRDAINVASRPLIRHLTILDLPDEILTDIFRFARGLEPDERFIHISAVSVADVKNLRLTCWRFHDLSSCLLLHFVRVSLESSSLSHIDEVSRHQTISKGVRGIRIVLDFYESSLASNIMIFAAYHATELLEETEHWASPDVWKTLELSERDSIEKAEAIADSWSGLAKGLPDNPDQEADTQYRMLIHRAHREYQLRFAEQEKLRSEGTFVEAVATILKRMPTVNRLDFRDQEALSCRRRHPSYIKQVNDSDLLVQILLRPISWTEANYYPLGVPPADLLVKLLCATHKSGSLITSIEIRLSHLVRQADLAMSPIEQREIRALVQRLDHLTFKLGASNSISPDRPHPSENDTELGKYVGTLLDTHSLRDISLEFGSFWYSENPHLFDQGTGIMWRSWPKLTNLDITDIPLHLSELKSIFGQLNETYPVVWLARVHLLSGSWAEVLDIMRMKLGPYSSINCPSGAELGDFPDEEQKAMFEPIDDNINGNSIVDDYIEGRIEQNPLRDEERSQLI